MNYQSLYMEKIDLKIYDNECIICMEATDDNKAQTIEVHRIPRLIRACKCEYLVHETCLRDWLSNTPACPICKEIIFYNDPHPPKKYKSRNREQCTSPSIARCLNRYLCCVSSPENMRRE